MIIQPELKSISLVSGSKVNLKAAVGNPTNPVALECNILSGAVIDSNADGVASAANAALRTGGFAHGSQIRIHMFGTSEIRGKGGDGGMGTDQSLGKAGTATGGGGGGGAGNDVGSGGAPGGTVSTAGQPGTDTTGGAGGSGASNDSNGINASTPGQQGGTALWLEDDVILKMSSGSKLWAGGGGGGGGGINAAGGAGGAPGEQGSTGAGSLSFEVGGAAGFGIKMNSFTVNGLTGGAIYSVGSIRGQVA